MILLIGSEGNMGKRYKAIFNHLGIDYSTFDSAIDCHIHSYAKYAKGFLIATPTDTHTDLIFQLAPYKRPILCEKPITRDPTELAAVLMLKPKLQMVNQYAHMPISKSKNKPTSYNYYRHGGDGLNWDCINVIGLAKGPVKLDQQSPVWNCTINGKKLNLSDMDHAYISMIKSWVKNPEPNLDYIAMAHGKVLDL